MCRALFGCLENVREKRRIGRGVVVDLRFLRVEEDGKSRVFFFFRQVPFRFLGIQTEGKDFFVFVL